eukprot:g47147.t1
MRWKTSSSTSSMQWLTCTPRWNCISWMTARSRTQLLVQQVRKEASAKYQRKSALSLNWIVVTVRLFRRGKMPDLVTAYRKHMYF